MSSWTKDFALLVEAGSRRTTRGSGVGTGEEGEVSPALFLKLKKVPRFCKKGPNCVHPWVKLSIQNVVSSTSRRKSFIFFLWRPFLLRFWKKIYQSALISPNLLCPNYLHETLHLRCLTDFSEHGSALDLFQFP